MPLRSVLSASPSLHRDARPKVVDSHLINPNADCVRVRHWPKKEGIWWLWPHLLSLDAPLVAVVWERWWANAVDVHLPGGCELILGLGVWTVYIADRLADTAPLASDEHKTTRHAFYRQWHQAMRLTVAAVFAGLVWLAPSLLPVRQLLAGLCLLSLMGAYFWSIHRQATRDWPRFVPKEAVVGGMFAVGTGFFVLAHWRQVSLALLIALPMFAALCFFNCALITNWERNPLDARELSSLLNAFPRLVAKLRAGCLALALLALFCTAVIPSGAVFIPMTVSALLLSGLDWCSDRFSADALRVLADAVLLTPCLCMALSFHVH